MTAAAQDPPVGRKLHVIQGTHQVSRCQDDCMTTVLGSCVAACIYDPQAHVGGMNHFLLAEGGRDDSAMRYGAYAMEVLINDLMKAGARRDRLQAKLFGGAKMFDALNDVGASNAAFARRFLADEGIPVVSESLGGRQARRVEFWPATGRARQREAAANRTRDEAPQIPPPPLGGDIEMF
ncbi:MAG: chemotaxis protein CheD [Proteobacteria bacterium]|nr:chemotaxis protein CheD [Pseudomonadota bacterium]